MEDPNYILPAPKTVGRPQRGQMAQALWGVLQRSQIHRALSEGSVEDDVEQSGFVPTSPRSAQRRTLGDLMPESAPEAEHHRRNRAGLAAAALRRNVR